MKKLIYLTILLSFVFSLLVRASEPIAISNKDVTFCSVPLPQGNKNGVLLVSTGKWVIPPRFDRPLFFGSNNMAVVAVGDMNGIIDLLKMVFETFVEYIPQRN